MKWLVVACLVGTIASAVWRACRVERTAACELGWWVALSKPSHLVRADGSVAYTYWIHAQLGALTCEGFAYSYQDQLLRVAELCVSLQP